MSKTPHLITDIRRKSTPQQNAQYKPPTSTGATRSFLLEIMIGVANDKIDPAKAQSIARLSQQAYNFSKLELRAAELKAKHGQEIIIDSWEFHIDPNTIEGNVVESRSEDSPDDTR